MPQKPLPAAEPAVSKVTSSSSSYFKHSFIFDLRAGFITAIVALPLAIAFAIASGVDPVMGIYTAIIAGLLASILGGSAFSITGPTGAMSIIILTTMGQYGLEGLLLAGFLAGLMQFLMGFLRLGRLIKFIPFPIISGFTAGIGALILIGQIPGALGIAIPAQEHVWNTFIEVFTHLADFQLAALIITLFTILAMAYLPDLLKRIHLGAVPPSLIALVLSTAAVYVLSLQIPAVGTISASLPEFHLFAINLELIKQVLPAAFTIALLGAIEALLCAVVADGMTNTRHQSNKELRAQGLTNMIVPLFGGIPATAAVARTAVNIREGAKTRMSGIYHALILAIIILFFAPVAAFIPKAFLAGILIYVSFRMINVHEFRTIMRISRQETIVLFITFFLTFLTDLVFAVQVGMMMAIFLLFLRFANLFHIKNEVSEFDTDKDLAPLFTGDKKLQKLTGVYTVNGPFFFGALNVFDEIADEQMNVKKQHLIIRMKHVPFIDTSAMERLKTFIKDRNRLGYDVYLTTLQPKVLEVLKRDQEFRQLMKKNIAFDTTAQAVEHIKKTYV